MSREIKFSSNYNKKLHCDYYTTIRKYTEPSCQFYSSSCNQVYDVFCDGYLIHKAVLKGVDCQFINKVDKFLLTCDTGINNDDSIKGLFRKFGIAWTDRCLILLFNRCENY